LSLRSVIHSQPKGCFRVVLWTMTADTEKSLWATARKYNTNENDIVVTVKRIYWSDLADRVTRNFPDLAETLSLASPMMLSAFDGGAHDKKGLAKISDTIRVLVLAAYGGIYLDFDVLVLRSLRPLVLGNDFYYRWSTQKYCNTAVFGLSFKSRNAALLLKAGLKGISVSDMKQFSRQYHPANLHRLGRKQNATIEMLPSAYFDPLWVIRDENYKSAKEAAGQRYGASDWGTWWDEPVVAAASSVPILADNNNDNKALTTRSVEDFFPGAFAFHWHNQWNRAIAKGSMVGKFLEYYDRKEAAEGILLAV
jgi:hypothetical protein